MKEDNIDFSHKNLIDFSDLSAGEWNGIFTLAEKISENPTAYGDVCKGKILATLFYEPSTRTVFSFQSAMIRLGGNYISFTGTENSSVSKGENLRDTIKIVNNYADIIALRHPLEGAAYAASLYSKAPVINAGDGGHLHPTQTMLDIFTIQKLKNSCEHLSVGICGDLKYGRTVHSLLKAFESYKNNKFYLISVPELALPEQFMVKLKENNEFIFCDTIEECIDKLDVIYMTRIQKERLSAGEDYNTIKNKYILDQHKLGAAKNDLIILHPLPKVDEISYEVDDDPRAKYFLQAEFGLYIRMALIMTLIGRANNPSKIDYTEQSRCPNKKCVSNIEKYLPRKEKIVENKIMCAYCEHYIT